MTTWHGSHESGENLIYVKGAVERLRDRCTKGLNVAGTETELDKEASHRAANEMAAQGLRVLALARRQPPPELRQLAHVDVEGGPTLLGLQGISPGTPIV
jgi:Ca2+-transporting ATPase